jgi:ribose transport system permease protein
MKNTAKRKSVWSAAFQALRNYPVVLILLGLFLIFSLLYTQRFLSAINLTATLRQFVTLMLFAIGPSMVMVLGSMDLSFIGIWMLGSILLWLLSPILGPVALLVIPLVGVATGFLVGVVHTKGRIPSFILTLSLLITYWGITVLLAGGYPRNVPGYGFITARLIRRVPTPFLLSIPIILAAVFLSVRTRLGVYFCAIGSNEEGARLAGIKVDKYKILAFTISGAFTGVGSVILFQHLGGSASVEFNLNNVVRPLVAIILGGTPLVGGSGGPQRTILGVLTFAVLYRGLHLSPLRPELIDLVVGFVLIVSIILSSKGSTTRGVAIT